MRTAICCICTILTEERVLCGWFQKQLVVELTSNFLRESRLSHSDVSLHYEQHAGIGVQTVRQVKPGHLYGLRQHLLVRPVSEALVGGCAEVLLTYAQLACFLSSNGVFRHEDVRCTYHVPSEPWGEAKSETASFSLSANLPPKIVKVVMSMRNW